MSWRVGSTNVRLGRLAGDTNQGADGVAVGNRAGSTDQGGYAVSIGYQAGQTSQGKLAVGIGYESGQTSQGENSVSIGFRSGQTEQGASSVAIGNEAGKYTQGKLAVCLGNQAGTNNQGDMAISIGHVSGSMQQGANSIAFGFAAAYDRQGPNSVAVGYTSGRNTQGGQSVAIGNAAGRDGQGNRSVAIGQGTGMIAQGGDSLALGTVAGSRDQGSKSVCLGYFAGNRTIGDSTVAIGSFAMLDKGGEHSIGIGHRAGRSGDGGDCVVIGRQALEWLGEVGDDTNIDEEIAETEESEDGGEVDTKVYPRNAIAIGALACQTQASNNSITLNATGVALNNLVENSLVIKPVRNAAGPNTLTYNPATGEITYSTSSEETKENIHVYERDAAAILQSLVVKEFNYKNKNKYTRACPETLKLPVSFEDWVLANHPPTTETLEGDGLNGGDDGTIHDLDHEDVNLDLSLEELYAEYVQRQSIVRCEVVDKEETHIGLIAEDVQAVAPELVYDDLDGQALDVKWNSITAMLVKQNQDLVKQVATHEGVIGTLIERIGVLESKL